MQIKSNPGLPKGVIMFYGLNSFSLLPIPDGVEIELYGIKVWVDPKKISIVKNIGEI